MKNLFKLAGLVLVLFLAAHTVKAQERESRDFKVNAFKTLKAGSAFEVFITQGDKHSLTIVATKERHEGIIVENDGDKLYLRYEGKNEHWDWDDEEDRMTVYIEFKELEEIDLSAACRLEGENLIKQKEIEIETSGASHVSLELDVSLLKMDMAGASHVTLEGSATEQEVEVSGASHYNGYDLETRVTDIRATGASHAKVNASHDLTANASGVSNIRYKGKPEHVRENESTLSSVKRR